MILRLLWLAIIVKQIYLNYETILVKLNLHSILNKYNILTINNYPVIDNYKEFENNLIEHRKKQIIHNLSIIKENWYIVGKLNSCKFRTIELTKDKGFKYEKIYLLEEAKEKIQDIKNHLQYFHLSEILNILEITPEEYDTYLNFKLKESKEYQLGIKN